MNAVTDTLPPDELAMRNLEAQRSQINSPAQCAQRAAAWQATVAAKRERQRLLYGGRTPAEPQYH